MTTYVSTRVPTGGHTAAAATPIVPSSYSMIEAGITNQNVGTNFRWWSWTASQDGAVRVDSALSRPGPRAYGRGYVSLTVYRSESGAPGELVMTTASYVPEGDCFVAEAGETYFIMARPVSLTFGFYTDWGVMVRMSSFRPAETAWYQLPERTVNTYGGPEEPWAYTTQVNPWDRVAGTLPSVSRHGYSGSWEWQRSFHGLDPISEIPGELAVMLPWQFVVTGQSQAAWDGPDFSGGHRGVPPSPATLYGPLFYGGNGSAIAGAAWTYSEGGLGGAFIYVGSEIQAWGCAIFLSLNKERYLAGPMVFWTEPEMAAYAGYDPSEVVGYILEEDLPEIRRVQVRPDWTGELIGVGDLDAAHSDVFSQTESSPVEFWVSKSRFTPELYWPSGDALPPVASDWGPVIGRQSHPDGDLIPTPLWIEGGGQWPRHLIDEMNMGFVGTFSGTTQLWEVPQEVWQEALEVEQEMIDIEAAGIASAYEFPDLLEFETPLGLMFLVGIPEALAELPPGPGVPVPALHTTTAKGMVNLWIFPALTFRPSRYKIALAPDLEPVEPYPYTAGPQVLHQEFEPIPPN